MWRRPTWRMPRFLDYSPDSDLNGSRGQGRTINGVRRPPANLARRLVDASQEVLRPDRDLRLEDVAGLVGSARATLYYYFSGRDDLVAFLLEEHLTAAASAIDAATTPTEPADARLRSAVSALVEFLGGHPGVCSGLLS